MSSIRVQGEPEHADCQQGQPVQRHEDALAAVSVQGFGDEMGWERQERHNEQQQQVDPQQERIRSREPIGQRGVGQHAAPIVRKLTRYPR